MGRFMPRIILFFPAQGKREARMQHEVSRFAPVSNVKFAPAATDVAFFSDLIAEKIADSHCGWIYYYVRWER